MTQWNEVSSHISSLWKKSYEQSTAFNTTVGEEATRVVEGQFEQARELMELGMQTQSTLFNEWMKQTATARDMWTEAVQTISKSFEGATKPVKAAKAS